MLITRQKCAVYPETIFSYEGPCVCWHATIWWKAIGEDIKGRAWWRYLDDWYKGTKVGHCFIWKWGSELELIFFILHSRLFGVNFQVSIILLKEIFFFFFWYFMFINVTENYCENYIKHCCAHFTGHGCLFQDNCNWSFGRPFPSWSSPVSQLHIRGAPVASSGRKCIYSNSSTRTATCVACS